jgi:hypothetical protein
VTASKRNREEIERRLAAIDPSEPTRFHPVEEPQTHRPPAPPRPPSPAPTKPKPVDPYEVAKERFRVNLFELLHWQVPT